MDIDFKKLLWRAGFVTNFGGGVFIDKQKAQDFLHCSRRTLDRWIDKNDPCPRALSLLEMRQRCIPDSWKDFYFDRLDRLHFRGTRTGFEAKDVRELPRIHGQKRSFESDKDNLRAVLDEIRDNNAHEITRQQLLECANQIHAVIASPIFRLLDMRRHG